MATPLATVERDLLHYVTTWKSMQAQFMQSFPEMDFPPLLQKRIDAANILLKDSGRVSPWVMTDGEMRLDLDHPKELTLDFKTVLESIFFDKTSDFATLCDGYMNDSNSHADNTAIVSAFVWMAMLEYELNSLHQVQVLLAFIEATHKRSCTSYHSSQLLALGQCLQKEVLQLLQLREHLQNHFTTVCEVVRSIRFPDLEFRMQSFTQLKHKMSAYRSEHSNSLQSIITGIARDHKDLEALTETLASRSEASSSLLSSLSPEPRKGRLSLSSVFTRKSNNDSSPKEASVHCSHSAQEIGVAKTSAKSLKQEHQEHNSYSSTEVECDSDSWQNMDCVVTPSRANSGYNPREMHNLSQETFLNITNLASPLQGCYTVDTTDSELSKSSVAPNLESERTDNTKAGHSKDHAMPLTPPRGSESSSSWLSRKSWGKRNAPPEKHLEKHYLDLGESKVRELLNDARPEILFATLMTLTNDTLTRSKRVESSLKCVHHSLSSELENYFNMFLAWRQECDHAFLEHTQSSSVEQLSGVFYALSSNYREECRCKSRELSQKKLLKHVAKQAFSPLSTQHTSKVYLKMQQKQHWGEVFRAMSAYTEHTKRYRRQTATARNVLRTTAFGMVVLSLALLLGFIPAAAAVLTATEQCMVAGLGVFLSASAWFLCAQVERNAMRNYVFRETRQNPLPNDVFVEAASKRAAHSNIQVDQVAVQHNESDNNTLRSSLNI